MPGIVGIISKRPREECRCLVRSMVASMEHEAFYISGAHFVPEMGIYAGWVAHEDSFAAGQVFFNEQQDIALIFSGECFVDRQIRDDLRQKGHRFESNDGALLVHLYEEEGNRFFEKLNGLFSGLLIDKRLKNAFLFNDRYGVERIYWHETRDAIYFASEAKALLRVLPELRTFDEEGVAEFLTFGCALESRTLFRNINVLPGASLWSFENGKCYKRKYFSAETWESQPTLSTESFTSQFRETFKRILPRYFDSDSRIGISLTAGLDGRMIMACRPDTAEASVCYTFCGQNQQTLDAQLAAHVAEACGLEHQILRIGGDFFSNFALHADRTVYITDGCLGISGAHEIYLNGEARQIAPVRLTGVFGGEILRGVSMFKPIRLSPRLVNPDIGQSLSCFAQERKGNSQHPVTFAAFCEIPQKRFGPPAASRSQVTFRTPYLDNEIVALAYQIPESLRMSAIPALELIESNDPVLNNIPTDMGQIGEIRGIAAALRRFFSKATFKLDYLHNEGLPHWFSPLDPVFTRVASGLKIVGLHKYLHYRSWFRKELAEYVSEILSDSRIQQNPLWNSDFLGSMASEHIRGRKNYVLELDAVMTLEAVERLLFRDLCRESKPVAALATSAAIAVAPARHITPVKNEAQN